LFTDDFEIRGLLFGLTLRSPHAHARIRRINASRALAIPGVAAVLTHENVPRVPFTTAGQNFPEPSPYDTFILDRKVRFVGDRVAAVAAETLQAAERALEAIEVEYDILPAVFDPEEALRPGAPLLHDEPEARGIHDASRNLAAHIAAEVGDVDAALRSADRIFENTYTVPFVQQCHIEPHVVITYIDESGRLFIRTSTQVPFHVRRIVAQATGLSVRDIRVMKPRVGGGFGNKQEIVLEDLCAALTLATRRPVRMEYTRREEFESSRGRHPQRLTLRTGVRRDGSLVANEMRVLANTGAYGTHALTVQSCTGGKTLPLYRCPNLRFLAEAVYTNLPVAGAFRGYGVPQGFFALESHMDEIAGALGFDPLEFRRRNMMRAGDEDPLAVALGEGKPGQPRVVQSCGLPECIEKGAKGIGWGEPRLPSAPHKRRGVGMALAMHGTSIAGDDMGGAVIKVNEDGSFHLYVGATDIGTGSDTVLAQMAAETLGVTTREILVHSADTDMTPFDVGAYASSTTYVSGSAVVKAAEVVRGKLLGVAARMLQCSVSEVRLERGAARGPSGASIAIAEVACASLYGPGKEQIVGAASHLSADSPPPFSASFAEVEVDTETGQVEVLRYVTAVDLGRAINPQLAEGQIEGGLAQGIGYALWEEVCFGPDGRVLNPSFADYKIASALDMPPTEIFLIESLEPSGPFGAKSVAEIPIDSPAPAVANAIAAATGVRLRSLPMTAERVLLALRASGNRP
jgi:putative selenate reductase molybdopterin-binding subunit